MLAQTLASSGGVQTFPVVPRPIAGWGLVSALVLLIGAVLANLDLLGTMSGPGLEVAFAAPIAVAELALAGWLITRGFTARPPEPR